LILSNPHCRTASSPCTCSFVLGTHIFLIPFQY
jgi:hypothetical protein